MANSYQLVEHYGYDSVGNQTSVLGAQGDTLNVLRYNLLNLPEEYVKAGGDTVNYVYSADGEKLYVEENPSGGTLQGTEYAANYRIEDGTVTMIHTDAGYYTPLPTPAGTAPSYTHIWYLKDHLGNNRVLASGRGAALSRYHYDPYGVEISVVPTTPSGIFLSGMTESPYKYGGKEWSATTSTYDFEARYLSPAFHRFTTMDPMCEKYYSISPYAYCAGNPVNLVDPYGKYPIPIPLPVLEEIGRGFLLVVGLVSAHYGAEEGYKSGREFSLNNNDIEEGYRNQKKKEREQKEDLDRRQLEMQKSIKENFPDGNDPEIDPDKNPYFGPAAIGVGIAKLLDANKEWLHPISQEKEEQSKNSQEQKNDSFFSLRIMIEQWNHCLAELHRHQDNQ